MCICLSYVYLFISFVFVIPYVYLLYLMRICCILCVFVVLLCVFVVFICICCTLMCICCTVCVLIFLIQMPDCWLEVSIRKVLRPATSTQVFLVSLCLQANAEVVPQFPSCYYMPLMQPSRLNFPSYFFIFLYS